MKRKEIAFADVLAHLEAEDDDAASPAIPSIPAQGAKKEKHSVCSEVQTCMDPVSAVSNVDLANSTTARRSWKRPLRTLTSELLDVTSDNDPSLDVAGTNLDSLPRARDSTKQASGSAQELSLATLGNHIHAHPVSSHSGANHEISKACESGMNDTPSPGLGTNATASTSVLHVEDSCVPLIQTSAETEQTVSALLPSRLPSASNLHSSGSNVAKSCDNGSRAQISARGLRADARKAVEGFEEQGLYVAAKCGKRMPKTQSWCFVPLIYSALGSVPQHLQGEGIATQTQIEVAQHRWAELFSHWDIWKDALRRAIGAYGGVDKFVRDFLPQKASPKGGWNTALVYGEPRQFGRLPHPYGRRQDAALALLHVDVQNQIFASILAITTD
eukprot:TRINITY_DN7835_c1_g1_i1.p1 TRINITY_DN7835_c1_g1~~TRINITY_DN7835_c1_g1_i1.p1  ORF type:complete len:387 (-),score=46.18 TRINITY_DN7835_c1_g1_i1:139-1299(-)